MTRQQTPAPIITSTLPAEGFVRASQVLSVLGIGRSSLWAGVKTGRYSAPVKLGPRPLYLMRAFGTTWRVDDIRTFINKLSTQTTSNDNA